MLTSMTVAEALTAKHSDIRLASLKVERLG